MTANETGLMMLRRAFGTVAAPEKITQEAFEGNDRHLRRLARLKPGERAEPADLWEYTQDLLYTKIQGPLFAYMLPFLPGSMAPRLTWDPQWIRRIRRAILSCIGKPPGL